MGRIYQIKEKCKMKKCEIVIVTVGLLVILLGTYMLKNRTRTSKFKDYDFDYDSNCIFENGRKFETEDYYIDEVEDNETQEAKTVLTSKINKKVYSLNRKITENDNNMLYNFKYTEGDKAYCQVLDCISGEEKIVEIDTKTFKQRCLYSNNIRHDVYVFGVLVSYDDVLFDEAINEQINYFFFAKGRLIVCKKGYVVAYDGYKEEVIIDEHIDEVVYKDGVMKYKDSVRMEQEYRFE